MMSDEKCRAVVEFYRQFLIQNGAQSVCELSDLNLNSTLEDIYESVNNLLKNNPSIQDCHRSIALMSELLQKDDATKPLAINVDTHFKNRYEAINHLLSMLPKMAKFASQNRKEKFMRWSGFILGTIASFDYFFDKEMAFNSLLYMTTNVMHQDLAKGDRLAFMMRLGNIQGILCSFGAFTLNELRNHSKPDDKPETP